MAVDGFRLPPFKQSALLPSIKICQSKVQGTISYIDTSTQLGCLHMSVCVCVLFTKVFGLPNHDMSTLEILWDLGVAQESMAEHG